MNIKKGYVLVIALVFCLAMVGILGKINTAQGAFTLGATSISNDSAALDSDGNSHQSVAADANVNSDFGTSASGDSAFGAGVMGNILGANLSNTGNYIAGLIGHYNITGTNATNYPSGGVLAGIGDTTTTAKGAFVAYIDGDSGTTRAGAAFKLMSNNSTSASGFDYGLDLYDAAHDGYQATAAMIDTADIRLQNQETISNETDGTVAIGATSVTGTFIMPTNANTLVNGADASNTCSSTNKGSIVIDAANLFYGCDGTNWSKLSN